MTARKNQMTMANRIMAMFFIGLIFSLFAIGCKGERVNVLPLEESFSTVDPTPVSYTVIEDTVELDPIPGPEGGELVCKTVKVDASQVRDLSKLIDLGVANLYPGAIIQGGRLAEGEFISVDIETAGSTLIVDGLSGGQDVTADVPSLSEVDVKEGINDLLNDISGTVEGTAAEFSYVVEQAFSQEEFQFHAGLGIGFPLADVTANLYTSNATQSSRVMLQFNQKFYSISIPNPEDEYALFRRDQRTRLQDSDQISAGNPPLYVKTVHYGRQIFFLAESNYSTRDLSASLDAAYRGSGPELRLQSGVSVGEVIDNSKVTYVVRGGGAGIALKDAPSFDAVKEVIQAGAEWGLNNPGVPIAYDMRYLTNEPAYLEFSSIFERKECELLPAASPGPFEFQSEQVESFADLPTPIKIYKGDFNGDGLEDVALNHLGNSNVVKIGLGSSAGDFDFQPAVSHPATESWSQFTTHVGDFDGDGLDDLAWASPSISGNRFSAALSQGGSSWDFLPVNMIGAAGSGWEDYQSLTADTDDNGQTELIFNRLAPFEKNSVWSYELDANRDWNGTLLFDGSTNWKGYFPLVGNVNGGGEDLVWQELKDGRKRIYFGVRDAGQDKLRRIGPYDRAGAWDLYSSRVINANNDLQTDLLYYLAGPDSQMNIYADLTQPDGRPSFSSAQIIIREDVNWSDFELLIGDVNGDGIDDLVWVDESDGLSNNRIITGLGNTDGKFDFEVAEMQHPAEETWSQYVPILLDIDGDRNQDVVWIKPGSSASIYVGLGRG